MTSPFHEIFRAANWMRPLRPLNCVTRRLHPSSSCRWGFLGREHPGRVENHPDEATKVEPKDYLGDPILYWLDVFFSSKSPFLSCMKFIFLTRPVETPTTFFSGKMMLDSLRPGLISYLLGRKNSSPLGEINSENSRCYLSNFTVYLLQL